MSIDRSVQLPIMMPPTCWSVTTERASAASVTPTVSSWASLSRGDRLARSHTGAAGSGALVDIGLCSGDAGVDDGVLGEQASSSPDNAAKVATRRGEAMGPDLSG